MRALAAILFAGALATHATAAERATITGTVQDANGKPIEHATVLVYEAGVKKGYSIYCPTCWVDCGKHTLTDAGGKYTIGGLNPELVFKLLVVKDGYLAAFVEKVDPQNEPGNAAILKPRPAVENVSQIVRGRVVDTRGDPVPDAVVEQQGVTLPNGSTRFGGSADWIDPMAVTNQNGEFEIAYNKPATRMILQIRPRAMAPKFFTQPTGAERKTMVVSNGATLRGRLVFEGKPVANAEVALVSHARRMGVVYDEIRIGTDENGKFAITNVPPGRIWYAYPKMESLAARGIGGELVPCESKDDGEQVDLGDIQLTSAYTLRGRVLLPDDKPVPADMHVTLSDDRTLDAQISSIQPDGSFEFRGIPKGVYNLNAGVKGYRAAENFSGEVLVKGDVNRLIISMEPVKRP